MAVRVDQAGEQRAAASVDGDRGFGPRLSGAQQPYDLTIGADEQACKMLNVAGRVRLDTIGMVDESRGERGRGEQSRAEREEGLSHGALLSIVARQVNR